MFVTCPKCSVKYKIPSEIKLNQGQKMQCSSCQHTFRFYDKENEKTQEDPPVKNVLQPPADAVLSITHRDEQITIKEIPSSKENASVSLPEVFRPVQIQTNRSLKGYFLLLICCIILLFLAFAGWRYRDFFIMNTVFPTEENLLSQPRVKATKPPHQRKYPSHSKNVPITLPTDIPLIFDEVEPYQANQTVPEQSPKALPTVESVRFRKTATGEALLIEGTLKNSSSEVLNIPEKVYALGYGKRGDLLFEKEIYLPSGVLYPNVEQAFFGTYAPAKEEIQWIDIVLEK